MALFWNKYTRIFIVLYFVFVAVNYGLRQKSYSVSPKQFKQLAAKSAETKNARQASSSLLMAMRNQYGPLIPSAVEWFPIQLANHALNIFPIVTSLTEYAAVLGTPVGSSGRIGLHWSNSTCTVVQGSLSRVLDNVVLEEKQVFAQGANFRHGEFESYIYTLEKDTYVACYGRGFIPLSGIWTVTSSVNYGEPLGVTKFIFTSFRNYFDQLSLSLYQLFNHYKARATGEL